MLRKLSMTPEGMLFFKVLVALILSLHLEWEKDLPSTTTLPPSYKSQGEASNQ